MDPYSEEYEYPYGEYHGGETKDPKDHEVEIEEEEPVKDEVKDDNQIYWVLGAIAAVAVGYWIYQRGKNAGKPNVNLHGFAGGEPMGREYAEAILPEAHMEYSDTAKGGIEGKTSKAEAIQSLKEQTMEHLETATNAKGI